jgi:hypothetical protein
VDVTVTAQPSGLFAPTNFVATTITDNKITLTWASNIFAVTTHIRGKVGSYPVNVADGYEIYNGAGNTVDDNAVSLDETAANVYYIAYSVNGGGVHSPDKAQANTGGIGMTLIAFFGLALILTWVAVKSIYWPLKFLAGAVWFGILALWMNGVRPLNVVAASSTDTLFILIFSSMGLIMFAMIFWNPNDKATGGRFRFPGMATDEQRARSRTPTREERREAYTRRADDAYNGRR